MAPPINRRPGFSKRAQYSIFASYLLGILGAVLGLILLLRVNEAKGLEEAGR